MGTTSVRDGARAYFLFGLLSCAVSVRADDVATSGEGDANESNSSNAANNPAEPRFTLQYWNYYAPSSSELSGGTENGVVRSIIPFQIDGIQQIMHINPPIVTNPTAMSGPRTGLGDTQIYNFTLEKFDLGLPQKVPCGFGPLLAIPTRTSQNFGTNRLQAGAAGIALAPQNWGLLG